MIGSGLYSNFGKAVEDLITAFTQESESDEYREFWNKEIARLTEALEIYKPLWKEEQKRRKEARKAIAEKLRLAGHEHLADCLELNNYSSLAF